MNNLDIKIFAHMEKKVNYKIALVETIHKAWEKTGWSKSEFSKKAGVVPSAVTRLFDNLKLKEDEEPKKLISVENAYRFLTTLNLLNEDNEVPMSPPKDFYASKELKDKHRFLKYLIPAIEDNDEMMIKQAIRRAWEDNIGELPVLKGEGTQSGVDQKRKLKIN